MAHLPDISDAPDPPHMKSFPDKFYVAPQNAVTSDSCDTINFVVFLVLFNSDDKPVFIVEVKDDSWAQKAVLRYHADKQMRDWYSLMLDDCPTPLGRPVFGALVFSAPPCVSIVVIKNHMR